MRVPFLDLQAHHRPLREEFNRAIEEVIDCGAFAGGPFVTKFEEAFAPYCQCEHAIGVGSGTEALWLALLGLGVGPGDEVITVGSTFIATAEAITYAGATPVFVDIDEETYTMDPAALEAAVTPRTKAIIPVHLFGQMADMDPILAFARERGLFVIEDAAQAQGAEYKGRRAGSMGDAGCFSFYPGKNLGAFGEAGAVVTQNEELQAKIRMLVDHGQVVKYHHAMVGWNCRMDGIQAAVLRIKLAHLEKANDRRLERALQYDKVLEGVEGLTRPARRADGRHVYHIYAIRTANRDRLMKALADQGIGCGIHYPVPVHLQGAYRHLGYKEGNLPVSERCAKEFLSLPMYPELEPSSVEMVAEAVRSAVNTDLMALAE